MRGLLLREESKALRREAKRRGLGVEVGDLSLPFERTLLVGPSILPPWSLVERGFEALERWEMAAPLAGALAESVGGDSDRAWTQRVVRDLRVPLYSTDLILLRRCDETECFVALWKDERRVGDDRLAFLRALYLTKPLILALPRTWLSLSAVPEVVAPSVRHVSGDNRLVHVQIAPGRSVCCRAEEAEMYRARFAETAGRRR